MDKKQLLTAISLMAAGWTVVPAEAATNPFEKCVGLGEQEADCACAAALDSDTASVVQSFLNQYSEVAENTACAALASTLEPPAQSKGDDRGDTGGGVGGSGGSYN